LICVGNNDLKRLPIRHNVPQSASENNHVTSDVSIEFGKDSKQMDISQSNGFINSNESSQ